MEKVAFKNKKLKPTVYVIVFVVLCKNGLINSRLNHKYTRRYDTVEIYIRACRDYFTILMLISCRKAGKIFSELRTENSSHTCT